MPDATSTFRADRLAGESIEQAVGAWAISKGWTAHRTCGKVGGYDLMLTCTVEVKADRMALTTGNVAIEVSFRGAPSGISATTAPWWCIVVGDTGFMVRTDTLRREALRHPTRPAGDRKLAVVHLLPLAELKRIAQQIRLPSACAATDVPSTAPE